MIYDLDSGFYMDPEPNCIQILKGSLRDGTFYTMIQNEEKAVTGIDNALYLDINDDNLYMFKNNKYNLIQDQVKKDEDIINYMNNQTTNQYDIETVKSQISEQIKETVRLSMVAGAIYTSLMSVLTGLCTGFYMAFIIAAIIKAIMHNPIDHITRYLLIGSGSLLLMRVMNTYGLSWLTEKFAKLHIQEARYTFLQYAKYVNMEQWEIESVYKNQIVPFVADMVKDRLAVYRATEDNDTKN